MRRKVLASFVKLSVQEIFPNIQYFRNRDGSICGSSPIGFGNSNTQETNSTQNIDFSSLMDASMDNYAKSFSKSSNAVENTDAKAKYIIDSLDKNKNGTISINELNNFNNSNINTTLNKNINTLENQFKIYDINKDGELDIAEIKNVLGQNRYSSQELGQMAKELNENNSEFQKDKPIIQSSDTI